MTMEEQSAAISGATDALRKAERFGSRAAEMTLGNGIVLSLKPVPPLLLSTVARKAAELPDPPVTWIEEKQREEPNPNDEAWKAEVQKIETNAVLTMRNLALAVGTSVKYIPDGLFRPEDDHWLQAPSILMAVKHGLEIKADDPTERYLAWLLFYAFESYTDSQMAEQLVYELGSLNRQEVDEALESFRRLPEWRADYQPESNGTHTNGNRANRNSRRASSRNRGA